MATRDTQTWLNTLTLWRIPLVLSLVAVLLTLAACGSAAPTTTPAPTIAATATRATAATPGAAASPTLATPGTPAATSTISGTPGTPAATPGGAMPYPDSVRLAIKALANELRLPEDQIQVVSYESTEWSDSSLGCPEPGRTYLTVITPGYRIFLQASGQQYEVHTSEKGMVKRCPK